VTSIVLLLVVIVGAACTNVPPAQPTATGGQAAPTATPQVVSTAAPAQTPVATAANKLLVPTPSDDNRRPLAQFQPAQRADAFGGPAPMSIISNTIYLATIKTAKGNIVAELYQDTPISANNFVTLAKDGFYDGLTFHRVVPGFVIQGGDPLGTGQGGPGYTIPAEIKHIHLRGALAWARTGDQVNPQRASSGSQFYITLAATSDLDGQYTVFGQVIEGMDVVDKIAVGDKIDQIDISVGQTSKLPTPAPTATAGPTPTATPTREPLAPKPEAGRPLAKVPVEQRDKYYTMPPAMTIDPAKTYQATVSTAKGNFTLDLDTKTAPNAANSFVVLANLGFYDGMPVAYVQPDGFAVLGSPKSNEGSDAGYNLAAEGTAPAKIITGTVTMYPFPDTTDPTKYLANGSQVLIWLVQPPTAMQVPFSVIGRVSSGQDVVASLAAGDKIDKIEITEK
jgi:cyclophilin family peptidyl-prolyl cis-trans isomerase